MKRLQDQNVDIASLWRQLEEIVIKTIIAVQPYLEHGYRSSQCRLENYDLCFEILGFDILLDKNLKPWLLEVNHSPSLKTDTPLDKVIKEHLILDTLNIVNVKNKNNVQKMKYLKRRGESIQN